MFEVEMGHALPDANDSRMVNLVDDLRSSRPVQWIPSTSAHHLCVINIPAISLVVLMFWIG
jgi:hypothetical protein